MPEVAVTKTETTAPAVFAGKLFEPMFPFGRFFGLSPFAIMREFTNEMDRVFRANVPAEALAGWAPAVDVERCNGTIVVSAALPGVKKEELKVEVGGDALFIEGERKQEHKEDHKGYHRWECNYGHFYRSIPLPEGAKTDSIKAELRDGILKVRIPAPELTTKRHEVSVAG
jgi:HSP20 family protein